MSLFVKPIDQITFEDVEQFVANWKEGVRVEFKEDFPSNLPKSISSFANTLGGVIVLGVKEDKTTRTYSSVGINKDAGIKEKIIDSSVNGIYPAVIPDVSVIDIPSSINKVVVVIKVSESDLAPHAIQNSTKIYIRQENISQIINDADLDRIEFLLKRRKNSEIFRDELIQKMFDHCRIDLAQNKHPTITIQVSPLYPYRPIMSKDQLYQLANEYRTSRYEPFTIISEPIRVSDGVLGRFLQKEDFEYNRINEHGCFLSISTMDEVQMKCREAEVLFIHLRGVLVPLWTRLAFVSLFYRRCLPPYRGNLLVKVSLTNILNREMLFHEQMIEPRGYASHEKEVSLSQQFLANELNGNLHDIVKSIAKEIFWAFQANFPELDKHIDRCLVNNGLSSPKK